MKKYLLTMISIALVITLFSSAMIFKADDVSNALNVCVPLKAYPCAEADFDVYASDHTTRAGEIWTTDFCTINEFYSDGWCRVTYPLSSGATREAYTLTSNFIYDTSYAPTPYVTKAQVSVYAYKDSTTDVKWWTGIGDTIYIVGKYAERWQICYPIDEAYGGGYKLGWIESSAVDYKEKPDVYGDVNKDGKVNTLDRVALHRYLALGDGYSDGPVDLLAADVNEDGFVNAADALIIARHIAKWQGYQSLPYVEE